MQIDFTAKKRIEALLKQLKIDTSVDAELVRGYLLLAFIQSFSDGKRPYYANINKNLFFKFLQRYQIDFFMSTAEFSDAHAEIVDVLCALLEENDLLNYRHFFTEFSPYIVADWDGFLACLSVEKSDAKKLLALHYLLKTNSNPRESGKTPNVIRADELREDDYWASVLELDMENISGCWSAIFNYDYPKIPTKINGNIRHAIKMYRVYYVPLERLFQDYYSIKKVGRAINDAINPWAYVHKGIKKLPVETNVSVSEELFDLAAFRLKDENPTDVIRGLFYPKHANDSTFECGFLYDQFVHTIEEDSSVLIVHPNPDFILKWLSDDRVPSSAKVRFAVPNQLFSDLYSHQFRGTTFIPFSGIKDVERADHILLTSRNLPTASTEELLSILDIPEGKMRIMALLPNILFDHEPTNIRAKIQDNGLSIDSLLMISPNVLSSIPRKKSLLYLHRCSEREMPPETFPAYSLEGRSDIDAETNYFVYKEHCEINCHTFFHSRLTIRSMFRCAVEEKNYPERDPKKHREQAVIYRFSEEIEIYYFIMANRKNRYAGKAYYCSGSIEEGSTRRRGKRLTDIIEKGLRAETEFEVVQRVESIAFDPRVEPFIVSDILGIYQGKMDAVSLKTLWFCCRHELQKSRGYDEEIAIEMFCGEHHELANLHPKFARQADYENALGIIMGYQSETTKLQFLHQLNTIFQAAVRQGHLTYNPISELVRECSNRATTEQMEVRNALVKKTFTPEEELKMWAFIGEELPSPKASVGHRCVRRYETEGVWLAAAIRLLTGMSAREVCALQWKDFVPIGNTGAYQFCVTKFIDSTGKIITHLSNEDMKKFRRVPIAQPLAGMLSNRSAYLERSMDKAALRESPIIALGTAKKGKKKSEFVKPQQITAYCKKVIAAAKIEAELLDLPDSDSAALRNIARYQGDIFQTNFRYRANHTCSMTRGEINYILGIDPPDTYSKHYCDYSNDFVQLAMVSKLQRWAADCPYLTTFIQDKKPTHRSQYIAVPSTRGGVASVEFLVEPEREEKCVFRLAVDCAHGVECTAIAYDMEAEE